MNESWKIMKSKKENTEQHGTEGLWPTQTSEISRVLLQTCKRTMNPTDPKVHFLIFSQELQISGEMWPYLKCMPGMNAWRFAIFTCRRHRQSLELRRTLPESRETNDVSLYAWFFSDHGWPWCLPWCSIPWFGKMPSFLHMLQLQELDGTTALFVVKLSGDVLTSGWEAKLQWFVRQTPCF